MTFFLQGENVQQSWTRPFKKLLFSFSMNNSCLYHNHRFTLLNHPTTFFSCLSLFSTEAFSLLEYLVLSSVLSFIARVRTILADEDGKWKGFGFSGNARSIGWPPLNYNHLVQQIVRNPCLTFSCIGGGLSSEKKPSWRTERLLKVECTTKLSLKCERDRIFLFNNFHAIFHQRCQVRKYLMKSFSKRCKLFMVTEKTFASWVIILITI